MLSIKWKGQYSHPLALDFFLQGQIEIGDPVKAVSPPNLLFYKTVSWITIILEYESGMQCGPEKSESKSGRASESRALIEI